MAPPRQVEDDEIVQFVYDYTNEHGYPPTVREIADECGLMRSSAQARLKRMFEQGILKRPPGVARGLSISEAGMKMISEPL